MIRRAKERPPVDHAAFRERWIALIGQAHQAVDVDSPDLRARLAERAVTARNIWTPPAPYPAGLLVLSFAQLAYAWGRQVDPALRAGTSPALIQAAGVADQVISAAVAAEAVIAPAPVAERTVRLPYADGDA